VAASSISGRRTVIAVDNSFSMRQANHFEQAKKDALDAVQSLGDGDKGQVITFGGAAKLLTEMTADKQVLRGAIQALEPGDDASSYSELSRVLRSTVETARTDITAEVFTDLQKSSWPASFADARLDPGTKLVIHSYGDKAIPNFTVENVDAPRRVFDTKKVRTLATIAGFNTPDATRTVTLVANGKTLETKQVKVPANGRATAEFLTLDVSYGATKCEIRIDSADAFPDDDRWLFSVVRSDPKPALLLHSSGDTISTLYVRTALEAATEPAFTIDSQTPEQATGATLSKYAFVILSDPGPLPQRLEDEVEKYVQNGGSILISLGKNSVAGAKLPAAGIQLLQIRTLMPDHERALTLGQIDNSYPSFGNGQSWNGVQFVQVAKLTLPQDADTRVAARLSDGTPLLVDRKTGEGHVIVLASALDNVANNLPTQPVWLPFIEQTTHEMGGLGAARTNYRVGSYVDLRTIKEQNVPVEIIGPDGKRALSLSDSAKATAYQFPTQGFFDIRRANGREEMASVNPDRRESDFTPLTTDTVNLWKNTGVGSYSGTSAASAANNKEETSEIWWWVLALLVLLAIAEAIVGNRHLEYAGKEVG
jgi:hypothetical protein